MLTSGYEQQVYYNMMIAAVPRHLCCRCRPRKRKETEGKDSRLEEQEVNVLAGRERRPAALSEKTQRIHPLSESPNFSGNLAP
jgi:hypothetical protein